MAARSSGLLHTIKLAFGVVPVVISAQLTVEMSDACGDAVPLRELPTDFEVYAGCLADADGTPRVIEILHPFTDCVIS